MFYLDNIFKMPVRSKSLKELINFFFASNYGNDEVKWTPHRYKHFPKKGMTGRDIIMSTKNGKPAKYYTREAGKIENIERKAWRAGTQVKKRKEWKVYRFPNTIGASNGQETCCVRVELTSNTLHGHPITEEEYNKLIK